MTTRKAPKVSVIMPAYNGSQFIRKTIRSVLSQSYLDFELIVTDDASTDKTGKIIKGICDRRIRYFRNKKNLGTSKTRNCGLNVARGQYITYCDHDDIMYKRHLEKMVKGLDNNPDIGIVLAQCRVVGMYKGRRYNYIQPNVKVIRDKLEITNIIGPPLNIMHRATCINKVGKFDESKALAVNSCEDWDLYIRIFDHFKPFQINMVLGKYVFHGKNRSVKTDFTKSKMYVIKKRIKKYRSHKMLEDFASRVIFRFSLELSYHREHIIYWPAIRNNLLNFKGKSRKALCNYCRSFEFYVKGYFSKSLPLFEQFLKWCSEEGFCNKEVTDDVMTVVNYFTAKCEEKTGKTRKAIKRLEKSLIIDKDFFPSKYLLVLLYFRIGKFRKALSIAKNFPLEIKYNIRGTYLMRKAQYRSAASFFKKALHINTNFATAEKNLFICKKLSLLE